MSPYCDNSRLGHSVPQQMGLKHTEAEMTSRENSTVSVHLPVGLFTDLDYRRNMSILGGEKTRKNYCQSHIKKKVHHHFDFSRFLMPVSTFFFHILLKCKRWTQGALA